MKILEMHTAVKQSQLLSLLQKKLNPLFHEQKQSDINFTIAEKSGAIEISQPQIYEGFLFRIEIEGTQLHITRSEHYVDDVNSITVESILNILFEKLSGSSGMSLVLEG